MSIIKVSKTYNFPVEKVWNAITKPEEMKKWYFHVHGFELKEGNVFTFYENETGGTYLHSCEILKVVPSVLFEHTWEHPSHSKGKSILRWDLVQLSPESTELTLTHSGLENFADAGPEFAPENYQGGWDAFIKTSLKNYLNGIEKLVFEIEIEATPERVWSVLWGKESYGQWTAAFSEGSYLEGEIKEGGRVHFLDNNGQGIYSDVVYLKENKWVIFSHFGYLKDGEELPLDEEAQAWTGSFESYKLTQTESGTRLRAEVDSEREYHETMKGKFSNAFKKLKEMCEEN
jgi:uncharacterized protein YndB with AHSA1/START domain